MYVVLPVNRRLPSTVLSRQFLELLIVEQVASGRRPHRHIQDRPSVRPLGTDQNDKMSCASVTWGGSAHLPRYLRAFSSKQDPDGRSHLGCQVKVTGRRR